MTEDLPSFFLDFGVDATVGGSAVRGIFDNGFTDTLGIVADTHPSLTCSASDASGAAVGTTVVVASVSYSVAEIQPDGTGLTRLVLKI